MVAGIRSRPPIRAGVLKSEVLADLPSGAARAVESAAVTESQGAIGKGVGGLAPHRDRKPSGGVDGDGAVKSEVVATARGRPEASCLDHSRARGNGPVMVRCLVTGLPAPRRCGIGICQRVTRHLLTNGRSKFRHYVRSEQGENTSSGSAYQMTLHEGLSRPRDAAARDTVVPAPHEEPALGNGAHPVPQGVVRSRQECECLTDFTEGAHSRPPGNCTVSVLTSCPWRFARTGQPSLPFS